MKVEFSNPISKQAAEDGTSRYVDGELDYISLYADNAEDRKWIAEVFSEAQKRRQQKRVQQRVMIVDVDEQKND